MDELPACSSVSALAGEVEHELAVARLRADQGELLAPPSEAELAVLRLLDGDMSVTAIAAESLPLAEHRPHAYAGPVPEARGQHARRCRGTGREARARGPNAITHVIFHSRAVRRPLTRNARLDAQSGAFPLALMLIVLRGGSVATTEGLSTLSQSVGYGLAAVFPLAVGALHGATGSWTPSLILLLALLVPQFAFGVAAGRNRRLAPA